jgi:predicted neuraminidase
MGGWSGSALNVKTSADEGRTWSKSRRLTLNPFLNVSSLVRNKPILTTDGRIGLPVYHELAIKYPQMLWLTPGTDGTVAEYRIRNLSAETDLIQPTLVPLDGDRVLMLLRDQSDQRQVRTAFSDDNGWTWSEAAACGLPNPDSAIDALRLGDGRILLVYNDAVSGRGESAAGGLRRRRPHLAAGPGHRVGARQGVFLSVPGGGPRRPDSPHLYVGTETDPPY